MRPGLVFVGVCVSGLLCSTGAQARPSFEVGGRLILDAAEQEIDSTAPGVASGSLSDRYIRTARLQLEGELTERLSFEVEAGVRDGGPEVNFEDLYLQYQASDALTLRLGNFRTFSLEALTSLNDVTLMSRGAFYDLIGGDRAASAEAVLTGERWRLSAAGVSDSINESDDDEDSRGFVVRGVFNPDVPGLDVAHLGAWARGRNAGPGSIRYAVRNNTNIGPRVTDAGARFASDRTIALEAAAVRGSFSVQSEYAWLEPERFGGGSTGQAEGWYAFMSWFPTGERRQYEDGEFDGPEVLRPVTRGGPGAVELALRRDEVDLSDFAAGPAGPPRAGRYGAWTLGATWYPVDGVRFMANYTAARNDLPSGQVDVDTLQVRAQYAF
jgi:phosphate-selective porin OprO/OprP